VKVMGDVRNDGRRGLTGTLIEGSTGLKYPQFETADGQTDV
jgi:hypothetical protein